MVSVRTFRDRELELNVKQTLKQASKKREVMAAIGAGVYLISAELRSQARYRYGKCALREGVTSP